jgi:hypothetical protein
MDKSSKQFLENIEARAAMIDPDESDVSTWPYLKCRELVRQKFAKMVEGMPETELGQLQLDVETARTQPINARWPYGGKPEQGDNSLRYALVGTLANLTPEDAREYLAAPGEL